MRVFAASDVKDDPDYAYRPNSYCGACHQQQLRDYSQSMMGKTPYDKVFQQFYLGLNARELGNVRIQAGGYSHLSDELLPGKLKNLLPASVS